MSSLRGFHWVASPFQPPLPQEGKGMGNKRSKHVQRDHGAFMLCPGLGETRLHLAQHHSLHAGYDLQGGDPWDSGCCQKLPAPQLEEQRERKLEAPAGYRTGAICWKGQSWVGLVWPQGILFPIIIEVRVPWPWGGLF